MKITKSRVRQLISESIKNTLSEVQVNGKEVEVSNGKIAINGESFAVQANAGFKTGYQFINVSLTKVSNTPDGLKVSGTALGTSISDLVASDKVKEIAKHVEAGKSVFEIIGKKATFKFLKDA